MLLPFFVGLKVMEAELKQRIAEIEAERERLEARRKDMCQRFEMLELKTEIAKLKGDKQAACYEDELVSLKIEFYGIRRQIAEITKRLEEERSRLGKRIPFPFCVLA